MKTAIQPFEFLTAGYLIRIANQKAGSIAELGRMADQLKLIPDKPQISRRRR